MKTIISIILILAVFQISYSQKLKYSRVNIHLKGIELKDLSAIGITVDNGRMNKGKIFTTEISELEIAKLKKNKISYEILIEDMSKYYKDRNKKKATQKKNNKSSQQLVTPANFHLGSMGGYFTYSEILQQLDSMRILFPELISAKQAIGTNITIEGRPIYFVKISSNPDIDQNKPRVLYTALHHAREPAGMQQLIFYMYYLLENYNTDTEIKNLVDNLEIYFVPCVNPDGYIYNETTDPSGGGMHRKNRRLTGGSNQGVDLNRNYGYFFGYDNSGSSPDISSDSYRGTAGFSEPETQIMKQFCETKSFKLALNYHCYSDLLIYPWGYSGNVETPDSLIYRKYAKLMTQANNYLYGTPLQTVGYTGNGVSDDWMYGEQSTKPKIFAFSPEAGNQDDGFWPAIERIEDICQINIEMNLYLAKFALKYGVTTDKTSLFINQTGHIKFTTQCIGLDVPADFEVSIQPVSPEILSTGSAVNISGLTTLQEKTDSISFELAPGIQPGQELRFVIITNNGLYSKSDTITKIFGQPNTVFFDPCNSVANWTVTSGWNTTTSSYHSYQKSITDSPNGDYNWNGVNSSITTTQAINLAGAAKAYLTYWTKWNIHDNQDYAQIKITTNNGTTWIPLTGKHTNIATGSQPAGQALYDGNKSEWTEEIIDISSYIGNSVKFRFSMRAFQNFQATYDGFYFDDFKVLTLSNSSTSISKLTTQELIVFPNPATVKIFINSVPAGSTLKIYDVSGNILLQKENIQQDETELDVSHLSNGVYYLNVIKNDSSSYYTKIAIINKD